MSITRFDIEWPGEANETRRVRVEADETSRTVLAQLPGGGRVVVDVVTARALSTGLHAAVFEALQPDGPFLKVGKEVVEP